MLKQDYINLNDLATVHAQVMGYGNPDDGWKTYSSGILSKVHDNGFALQGLANTLFFRGIGGSVWDDTWHEVLHEDNYSNFLDSVYLKQSGGTISGALTIQSGDDGKLIFDNTDTETYWSLIYFKQNGETYGRFGTQGTTDLSWNNSLILHSGNYESVVGNKFLKLSGGTLTDSVMVNHSSGSKGYLLLTNGASIGGLVTNGTAVELFNVNGYGIGVEGTSDVYVLTNWSKKTLLHAGNFNIYAPTLTGVGASGTWGIDISGSAATTNRFKLLSANSEIDLNTDLVGGGMAVQYNNYIDASWANSPFARYGAVIQFSNPQSGGGQELSGQLLWDINHSSTEDTTRGLWWRAADIRGFTNSKWHKIAFTDSTVAGAYTLKNTAGVSVAYVDTNGFFYIGDGIYADTSLKLIGKNIYFASGASATNGLILNPFGNVTIGSIDLAGTNYKLYVDGTMRAQCINIERSNEINAVDNSGSPLALCLNWSSTGNVILAQGGGNVGIGTGNVPYKFNVDGQIYATRQIYSDIGFILRTTDGKGTRASLSHSSNTLYIQSGYNDGSSTAGNMMISGVNTANLASFDVKANKSAFNGRLLVGNPTDSGWVPFQVKGAADIDGPLYISAHAKEGIYFNENGIHWHNTAAGWVSALMEFSSDALMLHQHTTISGDLKVTGNIIADGQVSSGGIEINPTTISTQISQLNATVEDLQSTVKLLQDELNSLK